MTASDPAAERPWFERRCEDVREHSVELGQKYCLVPTGLLQSVDHGLLHVHAVALHVDQPLAQQPRVELLEHVLVVKILEDGDAARKLVVDFSF